MPSTYEILDPFPYSAHIRHRDFHPPIISALGMERKGDLKFKVNLTFIMN